MPSVQIRAQTAQATVPPFTQAILDRYLAAHERYARRQPGGRRATIKYLQGPHLELGGRDLTEADFTGANLEGARLARARLERASLYCANLRLADARDADFRRADLRGTSLCGADLSGANLDEADMRQAMLARADLPGHFHLLSSCDEAAETEGAFRFSVDFTNCSMIGARLGGARLKHANFSGALMQGADLAGADLTGARFHDAVLTGVCLDRARIDAGALERCVMDPTPGAVRRAGELLVRIGHNRLWVESNGRSGRPAVLDDEDLRPLGAALAEQPLTALSARRCQAVGVDFREAQLQGACLDGADLRGADFTEADLRGASFVGARLSHARFAGADLRGLMLPGGQCREVDVSGAEMSPRAFDEAVTQ